MDVLCCIVKRILIIWLSLDGFNIIKGFLVEGLGGWVREGRYKNGGKVKRIIEFGIMDES